MNLRRSTRDFKLRMLRRYVTYIGVRISPNPPVVVYQMGKVASSSVRNALLLHGVGPVLHLHSFFPLRELDLERVQIDDDLREGLQAEIAHARTAFDQASWRHKFRLRYREKVYNEWIHRRCVERSPRTRFITLVRDPIAANISMFFQICEEYVGTPYAPGRFTTEELIEQFLERYDHTRPLTWFDAEMRGSTGIDVFAAPFPKDLGYGTLSQGRFDLLTLQCELGDGVKEKAISRFLDLDDFSMSRSNVGGKKDYAQQYREFKDTIRFSSSFLDAVYGSKYAGHFYSDSDLTRFRQRWTGATSP